MKKKLMPLAVGAAIAAATSAQAQMYLNNNGTGEVLVFPFYSAESGNTTNVNITNTTEVNKAVKIRIIEGENSQEVLDFNVYMSAEDHFSFAIAATEEGGAALITNDNTCTVPQIAPGTPVPFRNFNYDTDFNEDDPDTETDDDETFFDNTGIERTAVGYIEVIEMGQLMVADADWDADAETDPTANPIITAITHGADGVPADCTVPVTAWSGGGAWLTNAAYGFESAWSGGGLYGEATLINVNAAKAIGMDAVAIDGAVEGSGSVMHYPPGDEQPGMDSAGMSLSSYVLEGDEIVEMDWLTSVEAFSSLFMADKIANDYVTDAGIGGLTDWIVTMPTKGLHVNQVVVVPPFTTEWDGQTACELAVLDSVDREESNPAPAPGSVPDFSPAPPGTTADPNDLPLCYEVNVVQFGTSSAVGNESLAIGVNAELAGIDGWASIDFDPAGLDDADFALATLGRLMVEAAPGTDALRGLPVTGFAVQSYVNGSVNGSGNVANYAGAYLHKTETFRSVAISN